MRSLVIYQCAWCGAVKIAGGQYVSPSVQLPLIRTIILADMDGAETEHPVSHGICEACKASMVMAT